ncbi:hypothetical protein I3843_16G055000 [Carya illinoinensis]|nr:hypothetical protein I3843_16G055000 [Carya illinoinensis]
MESKGIRSIRLRNVQVSTAASLSRLPMGSRRVTPPHSETVMTNPISNPWLESVHGVSLWMLDASQTHLSTDELKRQFDQEGLMELQHSF